MTIDNEIETTQNTELDLRSNHTLSPNWLVETRKLQMDAYGTDPSVLRGLERAEYFRTQMLAGVAELMEGLNETAWKPWAVDAAGEVNLKEFVGEMVDTNHFIANALIAAGATDEMYWDAYKAKMDKNRERQQRAGGYNTTKNRCPKCKRELDREGAYVVRDVLARGTRNDHKLTCVGCSHEFVIVLDRGEALP